MAGRCHLRTERVRTAPTGAARTRSVLRAADGPRARAATGLLGASRTGRRARAAPRTRCRARAAPPGAPGSAREPQARRHGSAVRARACPQRPHRAAPAGPPGPWSGPDPGRPGPVPGRRQGPPGPSAGPVPWRPGVRTGTGARPRPGSRAPGMRRWPTALEPPLPLCGSTVSRMVENSFRKQNDRITRYSQVGATIGGPRARPPPRRAGNEARESRGTRPWQRRPASRTR